MDKEQILKRIATEKVEYSKLEQKKLLIDEKMKCKQQLMDKYALQISQYEINELNQILIANGTSMSEVLQTLKKGDLSIIQDKSNKDII